MEIEREGGEMTQEEKINLDQFTGTESYYSYAFGIRLTDGAKYLAEKAKCYWLFDIIASYQGKGKLSKEGFQVWYLNKSLDNTAIVICDDGNDKVLVEQRIPYTDFPLDSVKLYCIDKVILLPSEY